MTDSKLDPPAAQNPYMVLVTVGAQMPFDRLIGTVDAWAARHADISLFAQVGDTTHPPKHMPFVSRLDPREFLDRLRSASLVIAHAGVGSILTALEHGKPILIMPRRGALRETRNDHQIATARRLANRSGVHIAMNEVELIAHLDKLALMPSFANAAPISPYASTQLLQAIAEFVHAGATTRGVRTNSATRSTSPSAFT